SIRLAGKFKRAMAERVDLGIHRTFQNEPNNHTFRQGGSERKKDNFTRISSDTQIASDMAYHRLRHLGSPLESRFPSFKKDDAKGASELFDEKFGTVGGKFDNNSTGSNVATINSEYNVLERDFETKGNSCAIHDGCVNSLRSGSERTDNRVEDREHADVNVGIGCGQCPNRGTIKALQSRFGKLLRIGSLGGDAWKPTTPSKTCHLVHAHSRYTKEGSSIIKNQGSMSQVPVCEKTDGTASRCRDTSMLVDKFEDISRIATLLKFEILDEDPKELTYYITCIAKFYFDHIIIIGETNCGVIFLDCYGRVFLWDDENLLLWPLGNSPEEASKYTIKGKDRLGWFVKNGIVYDYIKKPQCVNLAYNILKYLEDDMVGDKEIPELGSCSECTTNILSLPIKALTILSCGHIFHRSCIEKQLLHTKPSTCPFTDCGKTVDIIMDPNSIRRGSQASSHSSGTSALTNLIGEKFVLNSPAIPEEGRQSVPMDVDPDVMEEGTGGFFDLYNTIINMEEQEEIAKRNVIKSYYNFGKALED
ncbi:10660_t:CDS:2, partial [Funneliformis geosporum]